MKTTDTLITFGDDLAISANLSLDATDDHVRYARELIGAAYGIADLIRARHAGGEGGASVGVTSDAVLGMQLILSVAEALLCMDASQQVQS